MTLPGRAERWDGEAVNPERRGPRHATASEMGSLPDSKEGRDEGHVRSAATPSSLVPFTAEPTTEDELPCRYEKPHEPHEWEDGWTRHCCPGLTRDEIAHRAWDDE